MFVLPRLTFVLLMGLLCCLATAETKPSAFTSDSPPASTYILKIAPHPANPDLLYAASPGAGLFRTRNGGDFWENISPKKSLHNFNTVVLDPLQPDTLYAGGRKTGLWVSQDGGVQWQPTALDQLTVLDLVIDPTDTKRLYILNSRGVWRSTSGAKGPWKQVFDYPEFINRTLPVEWPEPDWGVRLSRFQHLTIDPHHPQTLFFGVRWEGGFHRTDDGGVNWRHESIGPIFRRADRVLIDPVDPNILYAESHHQGLFKSFNRGRSWVSSSEGIEPQKRTPHYGAVLISGMAFDPQNPDIIYAGSDYSNWKSIDRGHTWQELGATLTCEFTRSFAVTSKAVYAGTNVGIYRSFDGGETWESCNRGLPARRVLQTVRGTFAGERFEFALCAGTPAVFRRSLDRGTDWISISWLFYEKGKSIAYDQEQQTLIVETAQGSRRSRDGGLRWNVPETVYQARAVKSPAPARSPARKGEDAYRHLPITIHGAPVPDDGPLATMYQRPPYVYIALVSPDYPEDGSTPYWSDSRKAELSPTLTVPEVILKQDPNIRVRVEVRDFQFGTRVGSAPLNHVGPTAVTVRR